MLESNFLEGVEWVGVESGVWLSDFSVNVDQSFESG